MISAIINPPPITTQSGSPGINVLLVAAVGSNPLTVLASVPGSVTVPFACDTSEAGAVAEVPVVVNCIGGEGLTTTGGPGDGGCAIGPVALGAVCVNGATLVADGVYVVPNIDFMGIARYWL
jgi:hypothetical protein